MLHRRPFKEWFRLRRLIPVSTILLVLATIILDVTGRLPAHVFERMVVLILGFLAIDALVERVGVVEGIEIGVQGLQNTVQEFSEPIHGTARQIAALDDLRKSMEQLRRPVGISNRATLNLDLNLPGAHHLDIAGITLLNIFNERRDLLEELLADGVQLRVLLLDPESHDWQAWVDAVPTEASRAHLDTTLGFLRVMHQNIPNAPLAVKYSPYLLPTCLVIVDPDMSGGRLVAEIVFPRVPGYQRPHVALSREHDRVWFDFFRKQFDDLWSRSSEVDLSQVRPESSQF